MIVDLVAEDVHTVKWGYNLADLQRLSGMAVARCRFRSGDYHEKIDAAWMGIAEALCVVDRPEPADLLNAGMSAVAEYGAALRHHHGLDSTTGDHGPRFIRYWTPGAATPFDERLVESMTVWSIWPALTDRQRRAVLALAVHGDYDRAAVAEGLTLTGYMSRLDRARRAFRGHWFDDETPPRRTMDRRAPRPAMHCGNARITRSQLDEIRARYEAGETQMALAVEYGSTSSTVSKLLRGMTRPVQEVTA